MERLSKRGEHLRTFLNNHAPPEDSQHLLQRPSEEVDSYISTPRLCSAHGQAKNPALHEVETEVTKKTC